MKVLYMNTFSVVNGGAERLLYDTCVELLNRGHQTAMVIANDDRRTQNPEWWPARMNRYYIPELIFPLADRRTYDRHRRSQSYREALRYLQDIIDIESPDVIHVHNFPSCEIFRELDVRVPLIRTIHSYESLCQMHLKLLPDGSICTYPLGRACKDVCGFEDTFRTVRVRCENRFSKKRFCRFLAISTYIRRILIENGFPRHKIRLLPNFTRLPHDRETIAEEDRILYVGRFTPEKGLLQLIRAMSRMRNKPILHIVGKDGILGQSSFQDLVERELSSSGVRAEQQPWVVGSDLRRCFARSKVVAVSSVWPEPFGLVGIEAMMQGKPVVAFDVGGVRDWLRHEETGYLVPPGDLEQYGARLDQLLDEDGLRRAMGENAQRYARGFFTARRHIEELLGIYREAMDEGSVDRSGGIPEVCDAQCGTGIPVGCASGPGP